MTAAVLTLGTHRAFPVAMHGEVRAEEQVSDSQEQRLGQRSSSIIIIQLICLERTDVQMYLYNCDKICTPYFDMVKNAKLF